jgi:hypothetical protein
MTEAPDLSEDFAGAPEAPADPDIAIEVAAGSDATMSVGLGGAVAASSSDDLASLVSSSTVYTSGSAERAATSGGPAPAPAPAAPGQAAASGYGSVQLTWTTEE